jgi:hypothetical protein
LLFAAGATPTPDLAGPVRAHVQAVKDALAPGTPATTTTTSTRPRPQPPPCSRPPPPAACRRSKLPTTPAR